MFELIKYISFLYLLTGAYLTFFGALKKLINNEFEKTVQANKDEFNSSSIFKIKLQSARVLLSVLSTLFWPFFLSSAYPSLKDRRSPIATALKFDAINGYGLLFCNACKHSEKITAFTHGLDEHEDGAQCQSCGSFHAISSKSHETNCKCGGLLSREHAIFCPKCRSGNLTYTTEYMN